MENLVNKELIAKGKNFYSMLNKPNTKGNYPSNCYEVGISEVEFSFPKSYSEDLVKNIFTEIIDDMIKEDEKTGEKFIKIKNSKFKIPVLANDGKTIIESPRISNGTNIIAKLTVKYSDTFNKYYLVVNGVKILDEYKEHNPFDNIDEYDVEF
jgi:hypothetical protein